MKEPIEVLVVEDDPKTLKMLVRLLESYEEFSVVGSCLSGRKAVEFVLEKRPVIVLLDLELPDIDGIDVTKQIKAIDGNIEILILTSFDDEVKVYQSIQAGAGGYLVKRVMPQRIRQSLLEVLAGGTVIEPRIARRFWNYFKSVVGSVDKMDQNLTKIEIDILQMIARGLTNQETSDVLNLNYRSVRHHLSNIYKKLGTNNRSQAVVIALSKGWIEL
jgi:DNA-binding NarL/FixJ family response regulator